MFNRWRTGEVKEFEGMYKNDLRDGMWKYYFDDGLKIEQGKYKDGKKEGEWLIFFEKIRK